MDPSSTAPVEAPLAYGKACVTCSRAKAKCVPGRDSNAKCHRCHRLNKDCQPSSAIPKSRAPRKAVASKTALLEEKLENIVSLLRSTHQHANDGFLDVLVPFSSSPSRSVDSAVLPVRFSDSRRQTNFSDAQDPNSCRSIASVNEYKYPTPDSQTSGHVEPSLEEATAILDTYRSSMVEYFPFCPISDSVTPAALRKDRPFFYSCIISIHYRDPDLQRTYNKELMGYLGDRMLVQGEKSLDLILGILVYARWAHYHFHSSPNLTNLLSLAIALIGDLSLSVPPRGGSNFAVFDETLRDYSCNPLPKITSETRTLEEQRIAVGVYFYSSVISRCFQRSEPMRYTSYIEECVRTLSENAEYQTDKSILYLVKLQQIRELISQNPWQYGSDSVASSTPSGLFLSSLRGQLKDFEKNLPTEIKGITAIMLLYHSVEISTYEIGFARTSTGDLMMTDFQLLDTLYKCLTATKSFYDVWFTMSPSDYLNFSLFNCTQLAHTLMVSQKLSTFQDPGWDLEVVRQTVDFSAVLEEMIVRFLAVKQVMGLDADELSCGDIFTRVATKLRRLKTYNDTKLAEALRKEDATDMQALGAAVPVDWMDLTDERWLREILGPWDNQLDQYLRNNLG